jgi:biopolymer transport protein ExbD
MKFRRRARPDASIELTPLIDVVFLLLIFFMVSTTFIRETELQVDLPEAAGQPQERDPVVIEVVVSADGQYAVNDRVLVNAQLETLLRALLEAADGDFSRRLYITADGNASHQSVVRVMDAAGQLGLTRLSITTREPGDGP